MLTQQTIEGLRSLRLPAMAQAYAEQMADPQTASLSFDERLGIIVDSEIVARENKRLTRLIREARLRLNACIEDIDYTHARGLDRSAMAGLRTCRWIEERLNVVITGPRGVGKSFMACALGNLACRNGYATRYYRLSRLLSELTLAKADGTYMRALQRLSKIQILIIDDFGLADMSTEDSRDLLEILDDRVAARSTIIASQIPLEQWHEALPDPSIADAILDRVIHSAHRIKLTGESMKKILAKPEQKELNNG
jgi:DNA replication protein DnaC